MKSGSVLDRELAALMEAAQAGDKEAYRRLIEVLLPFLRQTIRRRRAFLGRHGIEDLVQDVLLSVHVARATYDPKRPFLPWLQALARNSPRRRRQAVRASELPRSAFEARA